MKFPNFDLWLFGTKTLSDFGELLCPKCEGSKRNYDPDDPPDCIEGNKLRRTVPCVECKGTGLTTKQKLKPIYLKEKRDFISKIKKENRKILIKKLALKKLTKAEKKVLGLYD